MDGRVFSEQKEKIEFRIHLLPHLRFRTSKRHKLRISTDSELVLFFVHKPRQIGCAGFVVLCRVHFPNISFARHGAKQVASGFLAAHRFNHQPDSQRETPAKRIAFAEVHKLCVVVFDFLKYSVLLLRQRSRQFLLVTDHQLCCNVVLTAAHYFIFMRSDVAVVKIFECGHCAHLPFQAQQDTTGRLKSPEFFRAPEQIECPD